jgi:N-hydroxyarylamine O-acetyltransferase
LDTLSCMSSSGPEAGRDEVSEAGRREHVLDAALAVFARYGYRKASMEDVARAADISRLGLYFYFASKQDLFRAAVTHALDGDVAAAGRCLADSDRPLRDRLIEAFDHWTGRYIGPMTKDVGILIETNPDLLGPISTEYPMRFAKMVTDALTAGRPAECKGLASDVARTLLSIAVGVKHEVRTREEFLAGMTVGVDLLLPALNRSTGTSPHHPAAWRLWVITGSPEPHRHHGNLAAAFAPIRRMPVDHETVTAYLNRVGITAPVAGDAAGLRTLVGAHQLTVPFENLSIHLGEPISLDERDLIDKIVGRRRGGFCYELNGAFALLLEALGVQVTRVAARVYRDGCLGPPFAHLALIVRPADGSGPWLADVGFGSHVDYPLLLDARNGQEDPAGRFRLADAGAGDIDVLKDGTPQYRIETRERSLADCLPTCWWQQTSPLSRFTRSTICSRLTPGGRVSISGRMLIQTQGPTRTEQHLDTDDMLLAAYRDHFGIALSRVPADPAG